jgi:hypothetical protein
MRSRTPLILHQVTQLARAYLGAVYRCALIRIAGPVVLVDQGYYSDTSIHSLCRPFRLLIDGSTRATGSHVAPYACAKLRLLEQQIR